MSSLSVEPCMGESIIVTVFEIPVAEVCLSMDTRISVFGFLMIAECVRGRITWFRNFSNKSVSLFLA